MFARTFDLPIAGAPGTDDTLDARRAAADEASPRPGYSGWPGRLLFGVVVLLAVGVLLVLLDDGPADGICATAPCPRIPADVYVYVLFDPVDGAIAAVAFLVGLYLNVAVVRFDAIADQLFARLRRTVRRTDDGDERSEDS